MMPPSSYCGTPPLPGDLWLRWNLDPVLLLGIAAAGIVLWRMTAGAPPARRSAMLGVGVLLAAFVSPLCALTNALFAARTVHHILLILTAAPLLAAAFRAEKHPAGSPLPALLAAAAILWFWHWPPAYASALSSDSVYWAMQASLLGSAIWFWHRVLRPSAEPVTALLTILAAMAQMGLLGAILTFAPAPFYAAHFGTTAPFGFSPQEDQQLAGLIMWVPAMLPYFLAGALVARRAWRRDLSLA
ncbi:cytochrome c oxidase assembly protein [Sphingomonas mucosissima]|uniref:Cytochrome c oxidase caa3 assembly factor n=1 Tax=Sphingomonas mucosissima TaxID=370959 RepID=A0A245ZF22_9SPHN|nr:cytochrome c oxidase assembly protein [Sphingomonas mucosissima]OWK28313.1 cytochrome c oxidase caa3 assembly factor [Sphingomonas mucosissima]